METRLGLKERGRKGYLLAALVALLPTLVLPPDADAVPLTIDDIIVQHFEDGNLVDTSVLSGTADATFAGSTLTIILTNTSSGPTEFEGNPVAGATNILTGIGFNLPSGMSISSGSVSMVGETAINFPPPADGNISGEWGFDNDPIKGPFVDSDLTDKIVNTSVATMASSTTEAFGPSLFPPPSLDGPEMGLLSGDPDVPASTAGGLRAVQDSIVITLNLSGSFTPTASDPTLIAFINNRDVVLSFGSPDVIPEPSTLVLLGSGLTALGLLGRKKLVGGSSN